MSDSPRTTYAFFDEGTARVYRAIAARIVPSEPDSPGADSEAAVARTDRAIADRPARDRRLLALFLRVVEHLPRVRYARRFSALGPAQQDAVLAWLEGNSVLPKLRQGFFGVKTFALLGHYGGSETFAELRYPGPRMDAPYYQLGRGPGEKSRS